MVDEGDLTKFGGASEHVPTGTQRSQSENLQGCKQYDSSSETTS